MQPRLVFFLSLCASFNLGLTSNISQEEVEYYVNLITEAEKNASTYQLPVNAEEHKPIRNSKPQDFGTFDFIIIGAGSGGSVVTNRLSEVKNWKVLLLEAGSFGNNLTNIPGVNLPLQFSKFDWGYYSTPQQTASLGMVDHKCVYPRGKGVGGSTLINGLVYARGSSLDFDKWESLGNPGWSYKDVLPFFKKSENFNLRDKNAPVDYSVHGENGPLNVENHLPRSPQLNAWLKSNEELGLPVADYNAKTGLGASPSQINTINGTREDGGKAFILPILHRKNLKVLPGSYAFKIEIDEKTKITSGVSFTHEGKSYTAHANKEVILSAGAINSPHLLMLSGIGPKQHLKSLNIPVLQNLEVGSKLRDHATFYGLTFASNYTEPIKPLSEYVKEFLNGVGPFAISDNPTVGFYESSYTKGTGLPDIELMFNPANCTSDLQQRGWGLTDETAEVLWGHSNRTQTFSVYVVNLHDESHGTIRLKSNNPFDYPLIDPRHLSDPKNKDINTLYDGVQLVLKMVNTSALQKIGAKLQGGPLKACSHFEYTSKDYWYCAIRQLTFNLYHPVSTCPMGPDPSKGDVVNYEGKVHGIRNLRVADASVFPFTLAGHPNAPIVMVGEKISDLIKKEHLK